MSRTGKRHGNNRTDDLCITNALPQWGRAGEGTETVSRLSHTASMCYKRIFERP